MIAGDRGFVSIEPVTNGYRALLTVESITAGEGDPEDLAGRSASAYDESISKLRATLDEIRTFRATGKLIPARKVWQIGESVFELRTRLGTIGLQLDGVYDHLTRDLAVKRKWLEKAVTLRRYAPDVTSIPSALNWGKLEKGTRRKTERLVRRLPIE